MRLFASSLLALFLLATACGKDEMSLLSRIDSSISIEIRAPKEQLRGGCDLKFTERFCAEEYEVIGVIDLSAHESRTLAISDPVNDQRCTNVLWLRLVRLDEVGPVDDVGTTFLLPTSAEVEKGAGAFHGVAFPKGTFRIDEVGTADANQARSPLTCLELGREPR